MISGIVICSFCGGCVGPIFGSCVWVDVAVGVGVTVAVLVLVGGAVGVGVEAAAAGTVFA